MQEQEVDSLTLNNSIATNNRHSIIQYLNSVGILRYAYLNPAANKYELIISYDSPDNIISENRKVMGTFNDIDEAFIDFVMEYYNLVAKDK